MDDDKSSFSSRSEIFREAARKIEIRDRFPRIQETDLIAFARRRPKNGYWSHCFGRVSIPEEILHREIVVDSTIERRRVSTCILQLCSRGKSGSGSSADRLICIIQPITRDREMHKWRIYSGSIVTSVGLQNCRLTSRIGNRPDKSFVYR